MKKSAAPSILLVGVLLVIAAIAEARQAAKLTKIGFLTAEQPIPARMEAFRQRLRDLGYVEGRNLTIEIRDAKGNLERLPELANELVRLKLDVIIVAGSTPATLATKDATKATSIVFLGISDPVKTGLVDSLARPGGNLTGLTNIHTELSGKRLELLKETIPKLSRVAVLWDPRGTGSALSWKETQLAARELGLKVHSMEVRNVNDFENAFKEAIKARSGALAVTATPLLGASRKRIADLAVSARLPSLFATMEAVDAGGLMSYGAEHD